MAKSPTVGKRSREHSCGCPLGVGRVRNTAQGSWHYPVVSKTFSSRLVKRLHNKEPGDQPKMAEDRPINLKFRSPQETDLQDRRILHNRGTGAVEQREHLGNAEVPVFAHLQV